ncbi:hypothetical protein CCR75_003713 [Bremia lactucae]|uniref:Uncharacterized protein n=1 Tax=Bremia lactucae TaxID=4779 RepID=A0A976IKG1_BRELC|nr:hypothetical protein CCR75_003713 [Bremia lactucae]
MHESCELVAAAFGVRGAYEQGDDEEKSSYNDKSNQLRGSFDNATVLSKATEKMEDELETLLFELKL